MKAVTSGTQSSLSQTRRLSVAAGILALAVLAFVPEGTFADRVAFVALATLGFAAVVGWLEMTAGARDRAPTLDRPRDPTSRRWLFAAIAVTSVSALFAQSWFRPGTTVATGDLAPPDGIAWLGRIFEPWTWNGSNLGEPSQLPYALPWAGVVELVHVLGGNPELAQRVWYTALFVVAGLAVLGLVAALQLGPVAGVVATAMYLLNPYVISEVDINVIYLAALCPLAAMPAVLAAAGTGRLSVRWSAALLIVQAPLIGYIFSNPPLVGMILGAVLATPLLVAWVYGRQAAARSLSALSLAAPLFLALSAYWIIPAIVHLSGFASSQLATISSWSWTENRATIRNAFWLNNTWGWIYPEYYPYAKTYDMLPVSAIRFALPALAFGALALARGRDKSPHTEKQLRLALAFTTVALVLIFLSTGTNFPGNLVFVPLYNLPFGWLLREPGRFLMLGGLAYAVLIAITVESLSQARLLVLPAAAKSVLNRRSTTKPAQLRLPLYPTRRPIAQLAVEQFRDLRSRTKFTQRPIQLSQVRLAVVPLALAIALTLGFPMYTGAVVPDDRPLLPSAHVRVPAYWGEMAGFVDNLPIQGALLAMPPDPFYQMPYSWGYYGTDSTFVVDLFHRQVLVPNGQDYIGASNELMNAVNSTGQSILRHDWRQTEELITALNTPLVLVRRDINTDIASRSILSPVDLSVALTTAPNFTLIRQLGSLDLFALKNGTTDSGIGGNYVTVDTTTPDLRLLSSLPPRTALVSSSPRIGVPNVVQAPPLELWPENGDNLLWQPSAPPGSVYQLAELNSQTVIALDHPGTYTSNPSTARITYEPGSTNGGTVTVTLAGRGAVANGDFTNGSWSPVADCNAVLPTLAQPLLSAQVVPNLAPGGAPALQLAASYDSACVSQAVDWHSGPVLLSVMVNRVQGGSPRLCLFENGPQHCASLPSIPETAGWSTYRASVTPDVGTTGMTLYLYADAATQGSRTVDEYAGVRLIEVPALPSFALLGERSTPAPPTVELVVGHDSFSSAWRGTIGTHVLVNGMVNGWLIPKGHPFSAYYGPRDAFRAAQWVSLATLSGLFLLLSGWVSIGLYVRRRRRSGPLAASKSMVQD